MTAILANANSFLLNTDYEQDKVMGTFSGSFAISAQYSPFHPRRTETVIDHDFGDYGLIVGAYSTDNSTWYPFGVRVAAISSGLPTFQTVEVNAYCTTSQVVVQASNYTTSTPTVYYALQVLSRD